MNQIFGWCVWLLVWLANLTGLTYEQVNVIIFCIVWPLVTLALLFYMVRLRMQVARERADKALWQELLQYVKPGGDHYGEDRKEGGCCCGECGGKGGPGGDAAAAETDRK